MSIRTIKSGGYIIGFQAVRGTGGPGNTRYFGAATCGSVAAARRKAKALDAEWSSTPRQRPPLGANATGIAGLQIEQQDNTLYVKATWSRGGRPGATRYSIERNGKVGATLRALQARQRGMRSGTEPSERDARAAWDVLERVYL